MGGGPQTRRGSAGWSGDGWRPSYTRAVDGRDAGRRLAWSTAIFSLATGLSRILGLVREIVAAYYFGARGRINAFTVAFQIPNLVRALLADAAISSAFVPVFSELLEKGERKRAWRVASSLFWLILLGLGGLVVGILNSYEEFAIPALTPVFWNVAIIVGLVLGVPRADTIDAKLYVYAVAIVIATLIQFLLPLP